MLSRLLYVICVIGVAGICRVEPALEVNTGSVLIALHTADREIVVASDSRVVGVQDGRPVAVGDSACKIIEHNGTVFSMTGVTSGAGFDGVSIAKTVIDGGGSLERIASRFGERMLPVLNSVLKSGQMPGRTVLRFLFASVTSRGPALEWRYFEDRPEGTVALRSSGAWTPEARSTTPLLFGHTQPIRQQTGGRLPAFSSAQEAKSLAEQLISISAQDAASRVFVGGPVDVVVVQQTGIRWLQRKAGCG